MKHILILLLLLTVLSGCKLYNSPTGSYYPYWWGKPPTIQTQDHVHLPGGYGHGSSTLRSWIELNIKRDAIDKSLEKLYIDNNPQTLQEELR
jgi:hypothetical protein